MKSPYVTLMFCLPELVHCLALLKCFLSPVAWHDDLVGFVVNFLFGGHTVLFDVVYEELVLFVVA